MSNFAVLPQANAKDAILFAIGYLFILFSVVFTAAFLIGWGFGLGYN